MNEQWLIYHIYNPELEHDNFKRLRYIITPMTPGADERVRKELQGKEYIDVSFSLLGHLGHDVLVLPE